MAAVSPIWLGLFPAFHVVFSSSCDRVLSVDPRVSGVSLLWNSGYGSTTRRYFRTGLVFRTSMSTVASALRSLAWYELEPDGETSAITAQRRARDIVESALSNVPFHSSYGPCFVSVEYGLTDPPGRRVLLRELSDALAPYADPGQQLRLDPFLHLPCGVSLGLLPRRSRGPAVPPLEIGVEMSREGCFPDGELPRAMARALRHKTPRADLWKSENPDLECWLVFVDRIGTILFADTRDAVLDSWRAALDVPPVWDRIVFFVMGDPQRPAAEILARRGPYADMPRLAPVTGGSTIS